MKKVILSTVVAVGLVAFAGCAEKQSCDTKKVTPVAKKAAPAPVVKAAPAPAPVVVEAPAVIVEEAPIYDAKESATR